jgi:hypothetical protein
MSTSTDLFGSNDIPKKDRKSARWLMVTNQRNLLYMLAAGLIMPPKGFGEKYYEDTLCLFPGWVPLFSDGVTPAAVTQSITERKHLLPCLMEIDLSYISGKVTAIDKKGNAKEIDFPGELDGSEHILFVPTPLPINWIKSIIFQSKDDKARCETDAEDFNNVPLSSFKRQISSKLFSDKSDLIWPPTNIELANRDTPMDGPFAAGAIMAMLLQMANLGNLSINSCRLAFDAEGSVANSISDPMISSLGQWVFAGRAAKSENILQNLFWGAVDKLVAWKSSGSSQSALDVVFEHLKSAADRSEDQSQQVLSELTADLKAIAGFSDSTVTELLERYENPFSRVMVLFFLREECVDLLEFKHPMLNEIDYLAASILFAARDGWLGIPLEIRDHTGLQEAASHRMAAMAHQLSETGLGLGKPPARPLPIRELFNLGPKGWNKSQEKAAVALASDCKWDCLQTRIDLGAGDYRLEVDGKGMHILLPGEAKAVVTEVDKEHFFERLAGEYLTGKHERKVRDLLEK